MSQRGEGRAQAREGGKANSGTRSQLYFLTTMFAASDFRMSGPPVKVLACCR